MFGEIVMGVSIGEVIKYCRSEMGLTQKELATDQISVRYIGKIEKGTANITIELLSYISKRLGTNLFIMYGKMNKYESVETYSICQRISVAIGRHAIDEIRSCAEKYKNDERFKNGTEKKVLKYAEAIVLSAEKNYKAAISAAEEAVCKFDGGEHGILIEKEDISSVECALILSHAVNLCRIDDAEKGTAELNKLYKIAKEKVDSGLAEIEGDIDFYLDITCSCLYNLYIFSEESVLEEIEKLLETRRRRGSLHMVCELLLCKSALLMNSGNSEEARTTYSTAKYIGFFFYSEEYFEKKADSILNIKSDKKRFDIGKRTTG